MTDEFNSPVASNYFLDPGYIFVSLKPVAISTVLGSSVSVCLYDRRSKASGMNHFQFPAICKKNQATARYGNVAIPHLIRMMLAEGSKTENLEAQILGGAAGPEITTNNIGDENINVARRTLAERRIRIVSEDVGGEKGRKIVFNTSSNEVAVLKVDKIRKGDWYPYQNDR